MSDITEIKPVWQMTPDEFGELPEGAPYVAATKELADEMIEKWGGTRYRTFLISASGPNRINAYRTFLAFAVTIGKPVPTELRKDLPDKLSMYLY
jgi:hypothetical protein